MSENIKFKNFEIYLKELKSIVDELESGELSLDDSINKYKKGIELSNELKKMLESAKEAVVLKNN